ncbi:gluconate 2-dehydrogenase subunit 3 family protein, partial [Microbacteriaceae bacterium K1510]|nr:gluconate 2-dehydrogenase subunit 3 family protein [Microbacteriaceae bacterium K1510]
IEQQKVGVSEIWAKVPQKDFFTRMLYDIVSAYYSHPLVWSDIGYGGPAYPRGYVRVEKGLVDPWEAKQDGK